MKLTDIERVLLDQSRERTKVKIDGQVQEKTREELIISQLIKSALFGSPHSLNHVTRMMKDAQLKETAEIKRLMETAKTLKKHQALRLEKAQKTGKPTDSILPHPDDIIIDHSVGYRITGPFNEEELKEVQQWCALRDTYLLQHALEGRMGFSDIKSEPSSRLPEGSPFPGSALLDAILIEHGLPERFRRNELETILYLDRFNRRTKRELLKDAFEAWKAVGQPKPRGWRTPAFEKHLEIHEAAVDALRTLKTVEPHMLSAACEQLAWDLVRRFAPPQALLNGDSPERIEPCK